MEDKINIPLFIEGTLKMNNIINNSKIEVKEKEYRKKALNRVFNKMVDDNGIDYEYYSLIHEIKSLEFLSKYPNMKIALDHKHEMGSDFTIYNNYRIECVTCSPGDTSKNGLDKYIGEGIFDYGKKEDIILARILQALDSKKKFYFDHLNKPFFDKEPYIIFISLGDLSYGSFFGNYGFVLNKILLGVNHLECVFDRSTQKIITTQYSYRSTLKNHNNSEINCVFFNKKNDFLSAIIFTKTSIEDSYSPKNTFIFINPYAKNKIFINRFPNLVYWKEDKYGHYIPRKNGKRLKY